MERVTGIYLFFSVIVLLVILLVSSFYLGMINITGFATSTTKLNVTIGSGTAPVIVWVNVTSAHIPDLREGPSNTNITVNFTAYDPEGAANLNDSSAIVNINRTNENFRYSQECNKIITVGSYVNYTCNISIFWFDGDGIWTVNASIKDYSQFVAINASTTITINSLIGFTSGPESILFNQINAGTTNTTANNDPLVMNNTGNQLFNYNRIEINATNLRGETDNTRYIKSGNFSIGNWSGSNSECYIPTNATRMNSTAGNYVNVSQLILPDGNFTINNGVTGQEQLYFCILEAGSELTPQAYSTLQEGSWTIRVT